MKTKITRLLLSTVLMMCCMVANAVGTQPSGEGTPGNPYQIATKDNLLWFADYVNQGQEHLTACAILTDDITVNNGVLDSNGDLNNGTFEIWTPIGSWGSEPNTYKGFAGEFNGGGHTISGLYFNDETKAPVGLFGMADQNGYIHDVGITDSYFRAKSHVAGICGDLGYGRIENCWNAATVQSAEGTTGGIAGSCWKNSSVSGCYNIGKVAEGSYCGGICGSVAKNINGITSVSNCVSLEGKCSVAYNLYDDDAVIDNVTIQNASAFADGTVCGLLKTHSAEFIDGYIPTATTTGRYGHWHCCRCGKDFLDEACTTPATEDNLTVPVAKNNEIWYTTTDNRKLSPYKTDGFGATYNDAYNVYERGLGKITFDKDVTSIGKFAFSDCSSLKSISVPNSVNSIGQYAFDYCSQLQSITIPGSVKSMGWDVFDNCSNLNNVTIEDGAYIGMRVFQNYTGAITINGSLSGVDQKAFDGCTALTSVSVKSGSIVSDAFRGCTGLTSVSLLEGVNSIGAYAFQNCSNLKDIFVKWTKAEEIPSIDKNVFDGVDRAKATLHVPTNTTSLYQAKDIWKDFRIVEDVNFIITKTDDTKIEQKVVDNGSVTIDERNRNIKSLVVSEDVENVSVTYYRNFANAGKWQAWYVPFDVPVADMAQAGLDVAEIYGILLDNDNNAVIAFLKMNAGTVKANTPYVVRPKEYGDVTVTTTTTLYQTKPTQFAINSAKDTYTIGGIYEQTTTPGNWYAVNTSGQFQKMGTGVNLSPMRIWMTIDPRDDNPYTQPSEANAKMNIMVIGDDESTGIESLAPTLSESKGTIYNLSGQRVNSIQKGQVYIMNGKKFFAR